MAIWEGRDRLGRAVALTDAGWPHTLSRRPDFAGREHEIRAAVENPDRVTRDRAYPRREVCYREDPSGTALRVVVNYLPVPPQGAWAGTVVTAHDRKGVHPKEEPLWP